MRKKNLSNRFSGIGAIMSFFEDFQESFRIFLRTAAPFARRIPASHIYYCPMLILHTWTKKECNPYVERLWSFRANFELFSLNEITCLRIDLAVHARITQHRPSKDRSRLNTSYSYVSHRNGVTVALLYTKYLLARKLWHGLRHFTATVNATTSVAAFCETRPSHKDYFLFQWVCGLWIGFEHKSASHFTFLSRRCLLRSPPFQEGVNRWRKEVLNCTLTTIFLLCFLISILDITLNLVANFCETSWLCLEKLHRRTIRFHVYSFLSIVAKGNLHHRWFGCSIVCGSFVGLIDCWFK